MKIQINRQPRGSVLVVSLVIVTLILISLASYLLLVLNENQSVTRSQGWNTCVPIMEAGVEEALSQIHQCGCSNLSPNNWTLGSDGLYHKTRNVGTDGSYCKISIQPTNPPVIYSEAYAPALLSFQNASYSTNNFVKREVVVTTKDSGSAGGGLVAKGTITFSGGATFDSYNSSIAPYNPAAPGTNAIAISNTNVAGAINMTGGDIYGQAITGPGGTVTTSGNATIGDAAWNASGGNKSLSPNAETNWTANDANVQFNDIAVPYTSGAVLASGTYQGTNYTYLLDGTVNPQYYDNNVNGLTINGGRSVMIVGHVTLYETGSFTVSGNGTVAIAPNSSLTLYVGGAVNVSGNGIANMSALPANFTIYGLPTCTSITYSGTSAFQGTVNAPEASFTFSGGAGAFGAFTAHDITVTGSGGVHYDESLGAAKAFLMATWNEIQPQ